MEWSHLGLKKKDDEYDCNQSNDRCSDIPFCPNPVQSLRAVNLVLPDNIKFLRSVVC